MPELNLNLSRRRALLAAVALSAGAVVPAVAALAEPDPMLAAIEQ